MCNISFVDYLSFGISDSLFCLSAISSAQNMNIFMDKKNKQKKVSIFMDKKYEHKKSEHIYGQKI